MMIVTTTYVIQCFVLSTADLLYTFFFFFCPEFTDEEPNEALRSFCPKSFFYFVVELGNKPRSI